MNSMSFVPDQLLKLNQIVPSMGRPTTNPKKATAGPTSK
jgi:hypothetical protein